MKYSLLSVAVATLALGACTGPVIMGGDAAVIALSRPDSPPAADTASQIPAHESWCYSTMGEPECYAHAQAVPADRLINVEPQNRYPLDADGYRQAVAEKPLANSAPTSLPPASNMDVERKSLKEDLDATAPLTPQGH